jgi:hypothetical protein
MIISSYGTNCQGAELSALIAKRFGTEVTEPGPDTDVLVVQSHLRSGRPDVSAYPRATVISLPNLCFQGCWSLWWNPTTMRATGWEPMRPVQAALHGEFEPIWALVMSGRAPLEVASRHEASMAMLRQREAHGCNVHVCDYIEANYQLRRMYSTNNHPSVDLYYHMTDQALAILGEPPWHGYLPKAFAESVIPISPYDVEGLELAFPADSNWVPYYRQIVESVLRQE